MHRSQRFTSWRKGREMLLIRRLLLELPFPILSPPHSPANQSGSRPAMLHANQSISFLKQVFYPRYVQPHEMVRRHLRSRNPYVPQSWDTALSFCKFRSDPTQGRKWSRSCPGVLRSKPTPLRHLSLSPRPLHWCKIHCGLLPQRCPQPELGQDLCPQS